MVKRKSEGDIVSTRCSNVQYYLDSNLEWRGERGTTMSIKHGMIWWNFGGIYVFSKAFYPSNDRCKTNRKRCMKLRSRNLAPETAVALLCHHSFHSAQFSPMLHPDSQLLTSLNLFFWNIHPKYLWLGGMQCAHSARSNGDLVWWIVVPAWKFGVFGCDAKPWKPTIPTTDIPVLKLSLWSNFRGMICLVPPLTWFRC